MKTLAAFFMAAACAVAQETAPAEAPELITVRVGETVTVTLDGNPTTGFTWNVASVSSDAVKVSTAIMPAKLKKGEPPVCGAPAPTQVTFTGVKPGKSTVVLEYKRTWETEPAARTMTFVVTVSAE